MLRVTEMCISRYNTEETGQELGDWKNFSLFKSKGINEPRPWDLVSSYVCLFFSSPQFEIQVVSCKTIQRLTAKANVMAGSLYLVSQSSFLRPKRLEYYFHC